MAPNEPAWVGVRRVRRRLRVGLVLVVSRVEVVAMIAALWHRWFDSRGHRHAREAAEANYGQALVKLAFTKSRLATTEGLLKQATAERDALVEAAEGRDGLLREGLVNARKAHADALATIADLRRQLETAGDEKAALTAKWIADQHAQVVSLPPALTRDRENAVRLSAELAEARRQLEKCQEEHR